MINRVLMFVACFTVVMLCIGLWELMHEPFRPAALAVCVASFASVSLAFRVALGARSGWLFVASIASSLIFCLLYLAATISAYLQTGLLYPPAVIYPGLLALASGVIAFAVARQWPNNSFKPKPLRGSA